MYKRQEIEEAYAQVGSDFVDVMQKSAENIRLFHEKQLRSSWFDPRPDGTILGMKMLPIATAGVYVPGGKDVYKRQGFLILSVILRYGIV